MEEAGSSEGRRSRRSGDAKANAAVPGYLRPSAGSCHHVCKYGGTHTFEEREACKVAQARPRRQQQTAPPAPAPEPPLAKLRLGSSRRRVGDLIKPEKAGKPAAAIADAGKKDAGGRGAVVWKDIVAYESSSRLEKVAIAGDVKKKDVTKGTKKSSHGKTKIVNEQTDDLITPNKKQPDGSLKKKKLIGSAGPKLTGKLWSPEPRAGEVATPPPAKKMIKSRRSVTPTKPKKNLIEIQEKDRNEEIVQGDEAVAASDIKQEKSHHPVTQEEKSSRAAMAPAHRRAKSMSITGSKSVRFPFTRQVSRSSATFKVVRSKSSRALAAAAAAPPEEEHENPAPATRFRLFRKGDAGSSSRGGGIQLRIKSLRRRGSISSSSTAAAAGFVVPAVALRHQKTLEKKKSRRLYNSVIEETAGKLVKARKSRVKALVGAFESIISKIAK
ncbi:hypothetical protein GUJ93_ZPchr0012g21472 [Zizania palustris]|uniref:Calmodulin-binding domain-containing protein n=1 Tax=Zizania palustris TaxID=103762 RepID=A0A8J6BTT4_ZIZPA|nr:hypothetical protein GUJ93_ZPchr0012g21472 [Zizania palustris]